MTPEQLHILRHQLPPFGEGAKPSAELEEFCRFYGIDFTARIEGLTHLAGHVESGPYRLAVQHWRRAGAAANLLLVHGYFDHHGLYGRLAEWGLNNRCNVLVFDLPGHGLSTGEPAVIDDFADYSNAIEDLLTRVRMPDLPLWVMAQSTGAAAVIEFARRYDWRFEATVLLAPLVRPAAWPTLRIAHSLLRPFVDSIPRRLARNSGDTGFLEFLAREPLQYHRMPVHWVTSMRNWIATLERRDLGVGPALIVQGQRDTTVDWRYNVPFVETLFPGSRVEYLAGARHHLANESTELRRAYLSIVEDYLDGRGIDLGAPQS